MSFESQTADQVFQLGVNGVIYAIQVGATLTREIIDYIIKMQEEQNKSTLQRFFEEGEGVQAFNLSEKKLEVFQKAAEQIELQYYVASLDVTAPTGERTMTIYVKPKDVPNVNMIIEQNKLNVVDAGSAEVSGKDVEIDPKTPVVPGTELPKQEEKVRPTWADFINEDGQYETPKQQAQRKAQEANATPIKPESRESVGTHFETGSGQQNHSPFRAVNQPKPEQKAQAAQATSVPASSRSNETVFTGSDRKPMTEWLDEAKRIQAEKAAQAAKEQSMTPEAAQKAAQKAVEAVMGG